MDNLSPSPSYSERHAQLSLLSLLSSAYCSQGEYTAHTQSLEEMVERELEKDEKEFNDPAPAQAMESSIFLTLDYPSQSSTCYIFEIYLCINCNCVTHFTGTVCRGALS